MPACARPGTYVPRQTHDCDAAVLVRRHLAGFLAGLEETGQGPLPEFVKAELEGFAGCGDFEKGFIRTACRQCGDELRMPFACKGRGLCPSDPVLRCARKSPSSPASHHSAVPRPIILGRPCSSMSTIFRGSPSGCGEQCWRPIAGRSRRSSTASASSTSSPRRSSPSCSGSAAGCAARGRCIESSPRKANCASADVNVGTPSTSGPS